ncbi:hypothetical protein B0I37DRAFT_65712 [Chaetomium sp. MPI-CAGE-AT-0009]|nr:hypothetical protein B0I37DRAFT_65712 [Chaetomium sp. MPI-CAGE-AT-0009]
MMEPSRLPLELFDRVMGYATNGRSDVKILCNFSLVSSRWYAAMTSRIYSRWLYDGEHHTISSLWKFLRSILSNTRISDEVHELNILNWHLGLAPGRGRLVLSEDDLDFVRNAICTAGLERIENSALEALRKADPRPLMALLLANLPNLTSLYAHLPETDIFLAEVLRKAVEGQQDQQPPNSNPLLSRLREVHLGSAWNHRADKHARDAYTLRLSHIWRIFQLPSLQKLSVFDFEPLGASDYFGNSPKTSTITDLTLVHHIDALLAIPDTLALLALPKALTKLSISLNDGTSFRDRNQLSNVDLWNGIRQHGDSLEHLDVYRDSSGHTPPHHTPNNSYFGLMRGFTRLQHLCIQPEVLLGGCCGDDLAPFHLKDTLPPNLKSLTLYGGEGLAFNKTLGQQLQDVVASRDFRLLGHVALETDLSSTWFDFDPDPWSASLHDEVARACREAGRKYEVKDPSSCTKGGFGCQYYQHVIARRQQMGPKLEIVRFALTEYLSRPRESTEMGGRYTADRREFSLDDLDTYELPYELPWDEMVPGGSLYRDPQEESDSGRERDAESDYEPSLNFNEDGTDPQDLDWQPGDPEGNGGDSDG